VVRVAGSVPTVGRVRQSLRNRPERRRQFPALLSLNCQGSLSARPVGGRGVGRATSESRGIPMAVACPAGKGTTQKE
jgi:hypothetical protein